MAAVTCPFCSSARVERVSQWGGQIITAQWRCHDCSTYFEAVREAFDDTPGHGELADPVPVQRHQPHA